MTKPMVRIHNVKTDEIIDREMTDAEFVVYQAEKSNDLSFDFSNLSIEERITQSQIDKTQAATDKDALLLKLGISADEAKLLLS